MSDALAAPPLTLDHAQRRFAELRGADGVVDDAELDSIWAVLPVVGTDELTGLWGGGEFATGHRANGLLAKVGWYGKRFTSPTEVAPLICRDGEGQLYSNVDLGKGEASLWMIEFRGEVTASMVYDGKAIIDHFKRVDEQTVMGIMNGKDGVVDGRHLYFYLVRD